MRTSLLVVLLVLGLVTELRADNDGRSFAGSLQLDYLAVPSADHVRRTTLDAATVELSLKLTKDFSKDFSAAVKMCFACHGVEVAEASLDMRASELFRVRIGRFTPSFGSFPLRHDPANHLTSDKPLLYDMGRMVRRNDFDHGILPAPWVDNGIEIRGTAFWDGGSFDYGVFAIGGPKAGTDAVDFDFTESRSGAQYYIDNNSQPAVGGRVSLAFDLGETSNLVLGASGMTGHYDPDAKLGFVIAGGDAALRIGTAYLRAEWLIRRTRMALGANPETKFKYGPGGDGQYDTYFVKDGFVTEIEVPVSRVTGIARFDGLRRHGNVLAGSELSGYTYVLRYTAAIAIKIKQSVRIKASVEYYDFRDFRNEIAVHVGVATPF